MSAENHPHINVVGLATDIVCSIREHLRDEEHKKLQFDGLDDLIVEFCEKVEHLIDWEIYLPQILQCKIDQGKELSPFENYNAKRLGLL